MTKSTHTDKKTHEEFRGIILSIIKDKYRIHINGIKDIVEPEGPLHMSKPTVEKIVRELKNENLIKTRKSKNKIYYYLSRDWDDEEELEQDFKKFISIIRDRLKEFQKQYSKLNHNGKNHLVNRLEHVEEGLHPILESDFADIVPTEPDEDQMIKMIRALVKRSSDKTKKSMLQDAKTKYTEIKENKQKINEITINIKTVGKNSKKYYNLLHKRNELRHKRDTMLSQLGQIQLDLERIIRGYP